MLASHQPTAVEQLTLSSVKLYFSLSVGDCFYALWNETCSIISVLCVSTKRLLMKNKCPFFFVVMLFLLFVSSWYHAGVLYPLQEMMTSSLINHKKDVNKRGG
jgi:hypothetical protein